MWWSIYANDYRRIIYLNCGERYDCSSQLYTQKHRFCGPWFYKEDAESKEQQNVKNTTREKIQVISIDHRPWPQPRFQGKIPRNEVALTSCKETIKPPRWARMGIRKKSLVFLFSLIFIILQPIRIKSIMKLSRVARSVKHAQRAQKKERKRESHSKTHSWHTIRGVLKGGEKISVAGRPNAGKSSFVAALLRMPDAIEEARRCVSCSWPKSGSFWR